MSGITMMNFIVIPIFVCHMLSELTEIEGEYISRIIPVPMEDHT